MDLQQNSTWVYNFLRKTRFHKICNW